MSAEEITRGEIRRTLESLLRRHPAAFTKQAVYATLEPVTRALKKDLAAQAAKKTINKEKDNARA